MSKAEPRKWTVSANEQEYIIEYVPGGFFKQHKLYVNGSMIPLHTREHQTANGFDVPIPFSEGRIRFVMEGGVADVAVDGHYIDSGEMYKTPQKFNTLGFVLSLVCLILLAVFREPIPRVIAAVGTIICVSVAFSRTIQKKKRMAISIAITALTGVLSVAAFFLSDKFYTDTPNTFTAEGYSITLNQNFDHDPAFEVVDEGFVSVMGVHSDDVYVYVDVCTQSFLTVAGYNCASEEKYFERILEIDDVLQTEEGLYYAVFTYEDGQDDYFYLINVQLVDGEFWCTEFSCFAEDRARYESAMLEWMKTIEIAPETGN